MTELRFNPSITPASYGTLEYEPRAEAEPNVDDSFEEIWWPFNEQMANHLFGSKP